ncbi:MAG TPA: choice-of-anchor tandem repeat GloVer-containing protein [Terriglobales bacterium]
MAVLRAVSRLSLFIHLLAALMICQLAAAQTEAILHSFQGTPDGSVPSGGPIVDASGNIFDTTEQGGVYGAGTVYELTPPTQEGGDWTETILYSFTGLADGSFPIGSLAIDTSGNIYGTATAGGIIDRKCNEIGCGTVFELSPPTQQGGIWNFQVLYTFTGGHDGWEPTGLLLSGGTLYGTDISFNRHINQGTVFALRRKSDGWRIQVLHEFTGGHDGCEPSIEKLVTDAAGNLYGTTTSCGGYEKGTVFELARPVQPGGDWAISILHHFTGIDGSYPNGVVFNQAGNLYGTTFYGGTWNEGVLYRLSPPAQVGDEWKETVLHTFPSYDGDGSDPQSDLIIDRSGNIYGTTRYGGNAGNDSWGTLFELAPAVQGGPATERVLHTFTGLSGDGAQPWFGLAFLGNQIVGVTYQGGDIQLGTVFAVSLN